MIVLSDSVIILHMHVSKLCMKILKRLDDVALSSLILSRNSLSAWWYVQKYIYRVDKYMDKPLLGWLNPTYS